MSKRKADDSENSSSNETKNKKKTAASKNSPLLTNIISAIRSLKSSCGSSSQAIIKVLMSDYKFKNTTPQNKKVQNTLKTAVDNNILIQTKKSYSVAGDELYEDTSEKIEILSEVVGKGDGDIVKKGDHVVISYKGKLDESLGGGQFDSSNNFSFECGGGDVVKGMDESVLGMKIGGKRSVRIPPSLGYGKRGSLPEIPGNTVLLFDIVLKKIN